MGGPDCSRDFSPNLIDDLHPVVRLPERGAPRSKNLSSVEAPLIPRILVIRLRVRGGEKKKLFRSLILAPKAWLPSDIPRGSRGTGL